ncbi:MAG: chromosome segregation protein SMC [bacterium]
MYLQHLDILGFKSFARPTRLTFDPGMVAIVGPNGCGKSNVLDSIRWVLGEQSARILRGNKMEDVIFDGTENLKPLGMAEVSITFADCEKILGTEYNEVTIGRRVYRSGEGEYFINKTACRLKDIQRLFMNTGIGTASYSIMEQGRIDQILSSRPEDRREIFEEASGITKFKTDRDEAMRKLSQTEANLLRIADVITEVKRQIGSLERQAGKARRFKTLRDELRKLDLYVTKQRLVAHDTDISTLKSQVESIAAQLESADASIMMIEATNAALRKQISDTEQEIDALMEARSAASTQLQRARDLLRLNSDRIEESLQLSERDKEAIARTSAQLDRQKASLEELRSRQEAGRAELAVAETDRQRKLEQLACHEAATEELRRKVETFQSELLETENNLSGLQNELSDIDSSLRTDAVRRERLTVEKSNLEKESAAGQESQAALAEAVAKINAETGERAREVESLSEALGAARKDLAEAQSVSVSYKSDLAARGAQAKMLASADAQAATFPPGARLLMDMANPLELAEQAVLGPLVSQLDVDPEFRLPLEAILRSWCDAVVVADTATALKVIAKLEESKGGSVRLLAANAVTADLALPPPGPGARLLDHVRVPAPLAGLLGRLLDGVLVVDSLQGIPDPVPARSVYVTRSGAVVRGDGAAEFWTPDTERPNPLIQRRLLAEVNEAIQSLEQALAGQQEKCRAMDSAITAAGGTLEKARALLDDSRQRRAAKDGENQVISRQAAQIKDRLETVAWELGSLQKEDGTDAARRQDIIRRISELTDQRAKLRTDGEAAGRQVRALDQERSVFATEASEARLRCSEAAQQAKLMEDQLAMTSGRMVELEETVAHHTNALAARNASIEELRRSVEEANGQIVKLEQDQNNATARLDTARANRQHVEVRIQESDRDLASRRTVGDELRNRKSSLDVKLAESTMRRQNMLDRVTSEYSITAKDIMEEPDPAWEEGEPEIEWLDSRIAELNAKIDAMGPVNMGAVEEHQELLDRHTFLSTQHDDLVNARQKLIAMINQINKTTSEMFSQTFAAVNQNFDLMFKKLFNGGSAKLVLVNEEDVLESGVEIIARPPGKKLQTVTLLSGGERTLTAVSLLFAIYLIKPSPFCVLDELDAALDDSNIGRFVNILQEFLSRSQFLVITHSQQTIAAASTIYGVTMEEKGVSKLVSMKFVNGRPMPEKKTDSAQPAPAAK